MPGTKSRGEGDLGVVMGYRLLMGEAMGTRDMVMELGRRIDFDVSASFERRES